MANKPKFSEYIYPIELTTRSKKFLEGVFERFLDDSRKFDAFKQECEEARKNNLELYDYRVSLHSEILDKVRELYGNGSNAYSYMKRETVVSPISMTKLLAKFETALREYEAEREKKRKRRENYLLKKSMNMYATDILLELGCQEGYHFTRKYANSYMQEMKNDAITNLNHYKIPYTEENLFEVFAKNFQIDEYGNYVFYDRG